jgi:hypothetical protein
MAIFFQKKQLSYPHQKGFPLFLEPASAWMAILGLILFTVIGILVAPNILRLAFPVASFAVGFFLYQRYPLLYMGLTWWLWFLTPLVRRLVDFRDSYQEQSIILMTPFLVTLIVLPNFFQYLLRAYPYDQDGLPFILTFVGIYYSFLIGLVSQGLNFLLIRTCIEWITPLLFGFYIFTNWRNYPSYGKVIQRTFFWGAFVMGSYGLIQFLMLPPWDRSWKEEVLKANFGNVQHQIWSTCNSPGHFAVLMIPSLLLLAISKSSLRIPVTVISYLSFLLAQVRTCWGAWFIGMLVLIGNLHPRLQMRVIVFSLAIVLSVFPLATMEPFSTLITQRVETLSNINEDYSFQSRKMIYQALLDEALINPLGKGMTSLKLADSGILVIFYEMGWLGAIPFWSGLILLVLNMFRYSKEKSDLFMIASRGVACGIFASLPNGLAVTALPGVIFWGFASIVIAAQRYNKY